MGDIGVHPKDPSVVVEGFPQNVLWAPGFAMIPVKGSYIGVFFWGP